ncbi:hypothetical protein [Aurantibacillus circumpalustris]|uniref:hypothetical protein n=1 Tax=Aurantibacillus circumpalustris TaxID=3036359 RepID=UPI00295ACB5D|nr:hypothetical protein [Aurantibacillus circumpalustris]
MALKPKDKEALRDWESFRRSIELATIIVTDETYAQKKERIANLTKPGNQEAFAKYYFPHYCSAGFGTFQTRFFKELLNSIRAYITNKWSRDHAKSVTSDVIAVIYLWATNQMSNLLLVSHNETNAIELLTPLKLEFETNLRLINDFGNQVNPGSWEAGKIVTLNGCSFRALGAGQSPRGSRNQEARPDLIIVDDIDTEELCRNTRRLDELWEWVTGALYGCFSIQGRKRFIVVGNRIAKDCIVERAAAQSDYSEQVDILTKGKVDKAYVDQITKQVNSFKDKNHKDYKIWLEVVKYAREGYKPTWKERFTLFDCVYMITKMGYRMSQREYFNNPISEGKVFKKSWMQFKQLPPLRNYTRLLAYLDPGFKKTATSDSKCLVLVGMGNGEIHVRKVYCGKASVEEMIEWCYNMQEFVKRNGGAFRIKMEDVFLQSLLYKDFAAAAAKRYPLPVSSDTRKKPDKDARIESMSGYFERGSVFFDEDIKEEHHTQALIEQFLNFEPGVKTLKDGPDAFEGAVFLLEQGGITRPEDIDHGNYSHSKHKI